jgi:pimeloyl-ACP methyl ester carboxylesterase
MSRQKRIRKQAGYEQSLLGAGLKGIASLSFATAAGWIAYSYLAIDHNLPLPDAVPAERKSFTSRTAGRISYYHEPASEGHPLVLVHSVNAAASAYEMRPLFMHYRSRRPVYALDLPGFGFSERSKRTYSPQLYETALVDFLETQVGAPADIVALSLGSEFAARAAVTRPELFHSLTMISPTGFSRENAETKVQQASKRSMDGLALPMFSFPLWARPFYDLLTTRASMEYFLKKSFLHHIPGDLVDYAYAAAHQPGAEHAPLFFISGKLMTRNIRQQVYDHLTIPTLVLYDRDNYTTFDMLTESLARNKNLSGVRLVPSLGMPQFERTADTVEVLEQFWK